MSSFGDDPSVATDCALSIYSSRETPALLARTVVSALRAVARRGGVVDVVVNGHSALALALAADAGVAAALPPGVRLRIWSVAEGDKACAWNQYVHDIAPASAASYVFMDGYAQLDEAAVERLVDAMYAAGEALGATGVPRIGASSASFARDLNEHGGLHGNLYALKPIAFGELRRIGLRLPLGLYRNDSTLGAALSFGLNLFPRTWQAKQRITVAADAVWHWTPLAWWRPADWRTHFRRTVRQAQGELENAAVRDRYLVRRLPFESLPATACDLVHEWMAAAPEAAHQALNHRPLARRALRKLEQPRDWSRSHLPPQLMYDRRPCRAA